jgi:hypothetical protein
MNQTNLDYLKNGMQTMGFGDKLHQPLQTNIQHGLPQFILQLDGALGKDRMRFSLEFNRSEQNDRYFFNRYQATLKGEDQAQDRTQTFYLHRNAGITAREAYNLLQGRAVHKTLSTAEGQSYPAWVQLDFQQQDARGNYKLHQFGERYGYDLEKALSGLSIREMNDPGQKEQLLHALRKGDRTEVTIEKEGLQEKRLIEASPQFKSVNVYTEEGKKLFLNNKASENPSMKGRMIKSYGMGEDEGTSDKESPKRKGLSM